MRGRQERRATYVIDPAWPLVSASFVHGLYYEKELKISHTKKPTINMFSLLPLNTNTRNTWTGNTNLHYCDIILMLVDRFHDKNREFGWGMFSEFSASVHAIDTLLTVPRK